MAEQTCRTLPDHMKVYMAKNNIRFYIINATKIAAEIGFGNRTNTIMQAAFFKISGVIPFDKAVEEMTHAIYKTYGKNGEDIVKMNYAAVDRGGDVVEVKVPAEWANITVKEEQHSACLSKPAFVRNIVEPINNLKGDQLPVSAFTSREDGTWDAGTAAYEKRGIAVNVPEWDADSCIQCTVFASSALTQNPSVLLTREAAAAPAGMTLPQGKANLKAYKYRIQVSPLDCTGCGNCVDACLAPAKALKMKPLEAQLKEEQNWNYLNDKVGYKENVMDKTKTIKGNQFLNSVEFSGACAVCGRTPISDITTLFARQDVWLPTPTGCTSSTRFGSVDSLFAKRTGSGPPGPTRSSRITPSRLGMHVAIGKRRNLSRVDAQGIAESSALDELKATMQDGSCRTRSSSKSADVSARLIPMMEACGGDTSRLFLPRKTAGQKSQWIIGGDAGLRYWLRCVDHVLPRANMFNILIVDTEVYSNTAVSRRKLPCGCGCQICLRRQTYSQERYGAIARLRPTLCASGFDANPNQLLTVLREASLPGRPGYRLRSCITPGIKGPV